MWITNKLENRQTLKGESRSSFGRTRGKQGKFPFMGQKTRLRLLTIDNSFLRTPLKSEWNMPFWVAPAGNNGTSEKVGLFFFFRTEIRVQFFKAIFISLSGRPSWHFFDNGNRSLQMVMEVRVESYQCTNAPTARLPTLVRLAGTLTRD